MESLRDNFKYSVQKYCDFPEYLPIFIITIISNNPRRGYHNCPLSTGNSQLERSDKHQFIGELSVLDFSQQAVLIKAGDADAFHLVMMALPLGPDADIVFRVAGA